MIEACEAIHHRVLTCQFSSDFNYSKCIISFDNNNGTKLCCSKTVHRLDWILPQSIYTKNAAFRSANNIPEVWNEFLRR